MSKNPIQTFKLRMCHFFHSIDPKLHAKFAEQINERSLRYLKTDHWRILWTHRVNQGFKITTLKKRLGLIRKRKFMVTNGGKRIS